MVSLFFWLFFILLTDPLFSALVSSDLIFLLVSLALAL